MYRCRYFLNFRLPVREDVVVASALRRVQEEARSVLQERDYLRAEIWRDGRLVGTLAADTGLAA